MAKKQSRIEGQELELRIPVGDASLEGTLNYPEGAGGLVLFAHGSGSSRFSPRNRYVAADLQKHGLATLLLDLLTRDEETVDLRTSHLRFDIGLLAERLVLVTRWLSVNPDTHPLRVGYFGASTGAGAALVAAAELQDQIFAVVSRGGRPDLAEGALARVNAPTLLLVGGLDWPVLDMNRAAMRQMKAEVEMKVVPGATHLFEEPGALEQVARLATEWFGRHLEGRREQVA